ncbi:MAG: hypothetical protein H6656_22070 [Ardenticatenaceae bacterium]|nr:hypothetical protein [Anaerolineales bacterium]MCB9010023.1 hypothetical protein [Ardenticatenaceae bacterium]
MSNSEAKPQRPVESQKLTRRQVLRAVGATLVGGGSAAVFGKSLAAEPVSEEVPFVTGTLERIEQSDLLYLSALDPNQARQTITVKVLPTATISRGVQGIVNSTDGFVPGEKVVAEGDWVDGLFVATILMSLYYFVEGEVLARKQEQLETTAGVILLTPDTEPAAAAGYEAEPLEELAAGDEVAVLAWDDPTNDTYVAAKVGTRE